MVLYNLKVFCSDMKFKMAATAGLSLTLDPMGKMFQNASPLKPLNQIKPNLAGMILRWVPFQNCVRQPRPPFKMAAVTKNRNFFNCPFLL
jgi:hypothetical protein